MKRIGATILLILGAALMSSAQTTTLYFPQVVGGNGGGVTWQTAFVVTNPAAAGGGVANVTITLTQDDGSPFNIAAEFINAVSGAAGGTGNVLSFTVPAGQSRFFIQEEPSGNIRGGFGKLVSNIPVNATSVFSESYLVSGRDIALAGVAATTPAARQQALVVKNESNNVGIAYANPNSTTATVTFTLINTSGTTLGTQTRTLAANSHTALFVSELFTNLPATVFGTMQITTDAATPLVATTLLFTDEGLFATFPMFPLP